MPSTLATAVLSALTFGAAASASYITNCPTTNVCFSVGVPEASASSGSGNLYMQISAPTSYAWVGLATGSEMDGANFFILYEDGNGNVTVSPRTTSGHNMPTYTSSGAKLTLLAGSGVSGSTMTANLACSNCQSWSGGTMSLSGSSTPWIAAWKAGSPLATTDKSASIAYHDSHESWNFDLTKATVAADSNPFVTAAGTNTGSGSGSGGTTSNGVSQDASLAAIPRIIAAHGVIMAIVFVVLYPLGSILMFAVGKYQLHAAWQVLTFILMWVGFGIGVAAANKIRIGFSATHTAFGTAIVCLMILQPVLGQLHHMHFVKHGGRGAVSYAHIGYGRVLMALGVINGGLGLQLARAERRLNVAYAVVSAVMFVAYVGVKAFTSLRKRRNGGARSASSSPNGGNGGNMGPKARIGGPRKDGYATQEYEMPTRPSNGANRY